MTSQASAPGAGRRGRFDDVALAGLLVVVVALFVLPLPTPVLDLLIACNLALSLVLLIVAMYVPSALSLSTFPSLLLFTTLLRLSLNIASTKLILLHADAGHVIETFGKLIVGNNVVVGGVVFLIIAIVQFIVIAKGSERVAEVAARFALDAMPGKQMSIDADVRAGVLSNAQAQARRSALEQESALHGAMDGAMKFVKGDAIASIIIAIVNILAGIAIGTLMMGMGIGAALQRYAILTVGDGMVSQIPSLLVSIAAGVVITRVELPGRTKTRLAQQIGSQLLAHPRALLIAGLAVGSFVIVPGFPKWAFGGLALGIVGLGLAQGRRQRRGATPEWIAFEGGADDGAAAMLELRLAPALLERLDRHALETALAAARERVETDLGPVMPALRVRTDERAAEGGYQLLVQDVAVAAGSLRPGRRMLPAAGLAAVPADAEAAEAFGPFERVLWVDAAQADENTLTNETVLGLHLEQVVRLHIARLLGLQEVQGLVRRMQAEAPELATELLRTVPLQRVAETLRRLLQEGVPVRNLRTLFESLIQWAPKEADAVLLAELVRIDHGRIITARHVGPGRELRAVLVDAAVGDLVRSAIERSPRGNLLLLDPGTAQELREQVRRHVGPNPGRVAIVCAHDVRRYVKTLLEPAVPGLVALSYQELDDDVSIQPVGWVTLPPARGEARAA